MRSKPRWPTASLDEVQRKHPMNEQFKQGMARATELTQHGQLREATALIQSLLQAGAAVPQSAGPQATVQKATAPMTDTGVLEGTYTRVHDADPKPAPRSASRAAKGAVRKGLGETLRDLAAGKLDVATCRPTGRTGAELDSPLGAQFLSLAHAGALGSRQYRLYLPSKRPVGQMPLIVMLHGCTQSPEDFAIGTRMNAVAEEFGCLIAYIAQPHGANAQKCWNWFRPEDQGRGSGEPALIAGIVNDILRDHAANPARVYIAGLSAGGAAAAIMGAAYPDIIAAVGVHSGLPVGAARDVPSAFAAMRSGSQGKRTAVAVPVIVFHGNADATVHPDNGTAVIAQALQSRPGLSQVRVDGTSPMGRAYRTTRHECTDGRSVIEHWEIEGADHAWSGGQASGSYTDPTGPNASREMVRFFLQHHNG